MSERAVPLPTLTSLRFFAAAAVVLLHLWEHTHGSVHDALAPISRAGFIGVLFFFVLSGFLLRWTVRPGTWNFYRRRFARVYPAYFAALIVGAVVLVRVLHGTIGRAPAVASVLMLQTWAPQAVIYNQLDAPGWSLSAEAFFYALFPLLVLARIHR